MCTHTHTHPARRHDLYQPSPVCPLPAAQQAAHSPVHCWPGARCGARGGCWGTGCAAAVCWRQPQCQGAQLGTGGSAAAQELLPRAPGHLLGPRQCQWSWVRVVPLHSPPASPPPLPHRAAPGSAAKAAPSPRNPRPTSLPTTATAGVPTEAGPPLSTTCFQKRIAVTPMMRKDPREERALQWGGPGPPAPAGPRRAGHRQFCLVCLQPLSCCM